MHGTLVGVAWVFDGTCAGHNFWQALPLFCWRKFSLGCNFPFIGMAWGFAGGFGGAWGVSMGVVWFTCRLSVKATVVYIPSDYLTVCHGKSPFLMGQLTINGPFSIAMLNNQRVILLKILDRKIVVFQAVSSGSQLC